MPKFTAVKLIDANKVVNIRLLPQQCGDNLEWQVDDDMLIYNTKTKQFSLDVYEFQDDDWQCINTLNHKDAYQVALQSGIIYE